MSGLKSHKPRFSGDAPPDFDPKRDEWALDGPHGPWVPGGATWGSVGSTYYYRSRGPIYGRVHTDGSRSGGQPVGTNDRLPDDNPKTAQGALKTPLLSVVPAAALLQMGEVMRLGKEKYGPYNWRDYPVSYSTYVDAAMRHLMQFWDGETVDPESGQSHLAHAMAGLAVLADAIATGNATDDRPKPGAASDLIANFKANREAAA